MDFEIKNDSFVFNKSVIRKYTLEELETEIASLKYRYDKTKTPPTNKDPIPHIIDSFWTLLIFFKRFPQDFELAQFYINTQFKRKGKDIFVYKNEEFTMAELTGRVFRGYSSFVREAHFPLLCYFSNLFDSVYYSLRNDKAGIDVLITLNGKKYGVGLYTETKAGIEQRRDKLINRHPNLYKDVIVKDIVMSPSRFTAGSISLYDISDVKQLYTQLFN
jgi:hypothetical protein